MKAKVRFCPQAAAQVGTPGRHLGYLQYLARGASDMFLFLLPFGLLPQGVFSNASVLGQRAVVVLLVSGNSEAVFRAISDVCMRFSLHSLPTRALPSGFIFASLMDI